MMMKIMKKKKLMKKKRRRKKNPTFKNRNHFRNHFRNQIHAFLEMRIKRIAITSSNLPTNKIATKQTSNQKSTKLQI